MISKSDHLLDIIPQLLDLPGGVSVATDPSCREILHNAAAARFLRIQEGESFSFSSDIPPQVKAYDKCGRELGAHELSLQKALIDGRENKQVVELVWPDGIRKIGVWNSKPLVDGCGEIVGGVTISEDITEYALQERQIRDEREMLRVELERLDRLGHVSHLAAGISHEVRNPLTTVKGFLQVMLSKLKYRDDEAVINMMLEELDRASDIISDFLTLTKVHETQLSRGNILDVIERLLPLLENDAFLAKKKLDLRQNTISDIMMDAKEIKQLILNLVRNAIEATPEGGCVYIETFESHSTAGFTVRDEGDGIPKEVMEKLGTAFVTTKRNGTGVGLSICYDIAKRHNANIDVITGARGTAFTVKFPKPAREAGND